MCHSRSSSDQHTPWAWMESNARQHLTAVFWLRPTPLIGYSKFTSHSNLSLYPCCRLSHVTHIDREKTSNPRSPLSKGSKTSKPTAGDFKVTTDHTLKNQRNLLSQNRGWIILQNLIDFPSTPAAAQRRCTSPGNLISSRAPNPKPSSKKSRASIPSTFDEGCTASRG